MSEICADDVKETYPLFQMEKGGSIPTSAHQFKVELVWRSEVETIIVDNHYSKSINGVISDYCFALRFNGVTFGGAIFGSMAMKNQWKKYSDTESGIVELRRLALCDEAPKNSESFFISKCLKMLRKIGIKKVVTYADEEFGHKGTIYRASNFEYHGITPGGKIILYNGKRYHDKTIRTTYNGKLKPFAQEIKNALEEGTATLKKTKPKHIFMYKLTTP